MFATSDGKNGNHQCVDERPDETGDGMEVVAKKLHGETGGVVDCDVVAQHGEGEHDEAELGEPQGVQGFSDEATEPVVVICGCEDGVYGAADCGVPEAGTNHRDEDSGNGDTK